MAPRANKTSRFPAARIKKIMQMDEDVGKLASATPVMISKSLECFLQSLMEQTADTARERGSRKITAYHLKQTINAAPSFDFLRELVATVPDPVATADAGPGPSSSAAVKRERQHPDDEFSPYGAQAPRGRKPSTLVEGTSGGEKKRGRRKASEAMGGMSGQAYEEDSKPFFAAAGPHGVNSNSGPRGFSGAGGRDIMSSGDDQLPQAPPPPPPPASAAALPDIGTWRKDASGGGGRGEGGRGMFDDYEEDDDDY